MGIISERMGFIKPSPTLAISKKAADLRRQNIDVISLSAGEPDFDTPQNIKEAAIKAMAKGQTKYTAVAGTAELKEAVINKFKMENGLSYRADEVIVANGAKQIIFNALAASLNEGDEVIIPIPFWVSYPDMVKIAGGKVRLLACGEHFKIDIGLLSSAINERSKWLILNSPSNPSGVTYSSMELKEIAELLYKHPHLYVLSDDIYEHIVYDDCRFTTIANVAEDLKDRILTVNGVSKSYAMTGWRIGYAGGNKELIKAMGVMQSQTTSNPCSISQEAAIEALTGDQSFLREALVSYAKRRDIVVKEIEKIDFLECIRPAGAFYVFVDCRKVMGRSAKQGRKIDNSTAYADYLLERAKVAIVPGEAFGLNGYFRLSYATSEENILTALARIEQANKELL